MEVLHPVAVTAGLLTPFTEDWTMATQYASAAHAVYDTFATSHDHETFGIALLRGLNRHPSSLDEAAWWVELCAHFTKLPSSMRAATKLQRFAGRLCVKECGNSVR